MRRCKHDNIDCGYMLFNCYHRSIILRVYVIDMTMLCNLIVL
ncbi:hypothetical protein [Lactococcus phage PMBT68]|nr:hypothetical protein [Lactococcus phage P1411]